MAWYSGALRLELQPESDAQPAIVPDQLIFHSIAAPWDEHRIYEYWRDSTNLESHFGLDYDGSMGQFIGTETRADANMHANRRANGHGAVSIETASNLQHTDPWTKQQIEALIQLGVWMHQHHGLPLRICRTWDDPGYGYHRLFPEWSDGGTACPGDARVKQFREVVFPGIVARATGKPVPPPAPTPKPVYEPFPGAGWFTVGRKSPIVAAMRARLIAVGCNHYQSSSNKDVIGPGDKASYEAFQRLYNRQHNKGWSGSALTWPPGKETWDALKVPNV